MTNSPGRKWLQKAPLVVSVACLTVSTSSFASASDQQNLLADPKARQALKNLILRYKSHNAAQTASSAAESENSQSAVESVPNSQNIDTLPATTTETATISEPDYGAIEDGSRFAVGEELLLAVEIGKEDDKANLADVIAFKTETSVKVGLVTLIQLLELPITVSQDFSKANGWLFNENNSFSFALQNDQQILVKLSGKNWQLEPANYQLESDDLYIDMDLVAEWFGLSYQVDESKLKLSLTSSRQLPVELRMARRSREVKPLLTDKGSVMPLRETGYKAFTPPLMDAQVSINQDGNETQAAYSVTGAQDLAYFTGRFYLAGNNEDALSNTRLTFSRESAKNDLLGPLKATEYEFGDVQGANGGADAGRGVRVSNIPLVGSVDGQTVSFRGEVVDGWDIELYKNGVLINQQFAVTGGRYEFLDVQLDFGINNFELVFYGPQGQVETKSEVYTLDNETIQQGQFNYSASVVETNKNMLPFGNDVYEEEESGIQSTINAGYGLTDWLSASTGFGLYQPSIAGAEDQRSYAFGANISLFSLGLLSALRTEVEGQNSQNSINLRSQIAGQALAFSYRATEWLNPSLDNYGQNDKFYSAAIGGQLFTGTQLPVSYQNDFTRNTLAGKTTDSIRNAIGIRTPLGAFTNSLQWTKQDLTDTNGSTVIDLASADSYAARLLASQADDEFQTQAFDGRTVSGSLQYRNNFKSVFTRLFANYNLKPTKELASYGVSLNYPFSPDISTNLRVFRYQLTSQTTSRLGLNWRLDDLYLSASANYNNQSGWSGGINARFGFGVSEEVGYFASNTSISQAGAVTARVFEDKNLNGLKDESEPLISGAEVQSLQGARKKATTDQQGQAVLTGLSALQTTDIVVNRSSFEDPSMKSLIPGVAISARKGRIEHVDFPVTYTGELEGTLYMSDDKGEMQPAPYALIQLINAEGKVVDTAQSEFDGYYLFVDVVPGQYKVMIEPSFTNRRNLRIADPVYLAIRGKDLVNGNDIFLQQKEEASGYAAEIGTFSSLPILKTYWRLITSSGMNIARVKPFYLQDENTGRYVLRAAFSQDASYVEKVCNRLKARNFKCEVKEFTVGI